MARYDFPEKWQNLLIQIVKAMNTKNEKGTLTGLLALLGLVRKYEFEMDKDREPLYEIFA